MRESDRGQGVEGNEKRNIRLHKMLHEQRKGRGAPGSAPKGPIETKWKDDEGRSKTLLSLRKQDGPRIVFPLNTATVS